jgi:hypothetical protein
MDTLTKLAVRLPEEAVRLSEEAVRLPREAIVLLKGSLTRGFQLQVENRTSKKSQSKYYYKRNFHSQYLWN